MAGVIRCATTVARALYGVSGLLGVSLDDVLERHAVTARELDDVDRRVPAALEMDLFDALAERTHDPALGITLASLTAPLSFDLADYVCRHSVDLGTAYRNLMRYQRLLHDGVGLELKVDGKLARVVHHLTPGVRISRHSVDCGLAVMVARGRTFTGVDWTPRSLALRAPPPDDDRPWRRFYRVEVAFAQPVTELVFDRELLALPVTGADLALYQILERQAMERVAALDQRGDFIDQVRREMCRLVRGAVPKAGDVARRLGMSARNLHHRLRVEGVAFQALIDRVRLEMAAAYLADPRVKAVDVAFALGFSDASAFYRAFRRWTGTTPLEYRRANAMGSAG